MGLLACWLVEGKSARWEEHVFTRIIRAMCTFRAHGIREKGKKHQGILAHNLPADLHV